MRRSEAKRQAEAALPGDLPQQRYPPIAAKSAKSAKCVQLLCKAGDIRPATSGKSSWERVSTLPDANIIEALDVAFDGAAWMQIRCSTSPVWPTFCVTCPSNCSGAGRSSCGVPPVPKHLAEQEVSVSGAG
jgi:hypothetical protein